LSQTLPEGWAFTTLGSLSTYVTSGSRDWSKYYSDCGALFVRTQDINQNKLAPFGDIARVALPKQVEGKRTLIAQGDLLITITGANVGKCAHVDISVPEAYVSQSVALVRLARSCDGRFIKQQLISPSVDDERTLLQQSAYGVGRPVLNLDNLRDLPIHLAPISEERRIVAKVEELFALVNSARTRLSRVPAILKRFRQELLAAACSGRLTEDWRQQQAQPTDIVDRQLFELQRKRRELLKKDAKPASPNPNFEANSPESWRSVSIDELSTRITSGSRDWKRYYREDGTGTFIMAQNVRPLFFDRSFRLAVAPPHNNRDRTRSQVNEGDLLVTIVGANTGDVCQVPEPLKEHYVCQSVALIRPVSGLFSAFLELYLNSPAHGQAQYKDWIYGEGRPHLSFDQLRETAVTLPSIEEQQEIVNRVNRLFRLADLIEERVKKVSKCAERLTQSILAKAFRGELVPTEAELARREGRDYEPAAVLLERIKKEREAQISNKPERKRKRLKAELAAAKG
jgi:type I restriction enzyme S subunit